MNTAQVDRARDALDRSAPDEPEVLALVDGPAPDRAAWVAAVDAVLRKAKRLDDAAPPGAGVEALTRTTPDGIAVRPLYTAADVADLADVGVPGRRPFVRGDRARGAVPDGWDVRSWHAEPDPTAAREAILTDLANGAASVWLAVGGAGTAVADLPAVLDGVLLDLAPVVLEAADPDVGAAAAQAYLDLGAARVGPAALRGTLGLDPVGVRARTGSGPEVDSVVPIALRASRESPLVRALVVDGAAGARRGRVGQPGAGLPAQRRGGLPARAHRGRPRRRRRGPPAGVPARRHRRAVPDDREAARGAPAVGAGAGGERGRPRARRRAVHAVASPTMYTRRDPYVNLLRGTLAGFAAGVGGADAVTVAPFDAALGASTPFSRRIARNTQSLLVMEAHLARVIDPAGGSWFVESLTDGLARAAWAFFQELEAAGGAVAALDSGLVAERTAAVRAGPGGGRRDPPHPADRRERVPGPAREAGPAQRPRPARRARDGARRTAGVPARRRVRGLAGPLRRDPGRHGRAAAGLPRHPRAARRPRRPGRFHAKPAARGRDRHGRRRAHRRRRRRRGRLPRGRHAGRGAVRDRRALRRARRTRRRRPARRGRPPRPPRGEGPGGRARRAL